MSLPKDFWKQLPLKTEAELSDMLAHQEDYLPEAVAAARDEFRKRNLVSLSHGDVYKWKSGVCLQALQDVELMFPGILVDGPETFGSVMELSDPKTQIGIVNNPNGHGFESINVRLKAQCSLRLHKDTETVITFDSPAPALFRVEGS